MFTSLAKRSGLVLTFVLILVGALLLLPEKAAAADTVLSGSCGENVTFVLDSEGTLTLSGEGPMENYQIFLMSDFKYAPWMEHRDSVIRIVVEEGITSLGDYAFQRHTNVTEISLPESLTRIGVGAFNFCGNLTSIYIPPKVDFIGHLAFDATNNLKDVYISDMNAWLNIDFEPQLGAFGGRTQYFAKANPLWAADNLYLNGEPVTEVVIPEGITTLSPYVLSISTLEKVVIPEGVTSIGENAFRGSSLKEITLPHGVTSIGSWAFVDCKKLQSVEIPDTITQIDSLAFGYCDGLREITIPAGVKKLERNVFHSCDNLAAVTVSETLLSVGQNAFSGCYNLEDVYYYGSEEQWEALKKNTDPSNEYFLDATVHIKDQPLVVLSDIPSMNIEIGDTITLSAGVRVDQNTFENAAGITFQLANGSNLDVVNSGTEDGLFFVEFKGTYVGTTYVTFYDSISGQKVTVAITVSENNYFTYNVV